jgi:O-acetyl-ADP-ribose deacetylase (regulator of RNase III)
MHEALVAGTRILLVRGDITDQTTDAIVNAANSSLLGGGGVDGAIHRRGGPAILKACREIRAERFPAGLPAGEAVATTAGALDARYVIHTVGPLWRGGGSGEVEVLSAAWRNSLERAIELGLRSIAFPSISTGAYGYPVRAAARTAVATLVDFVTATPGVLDEIRVVLFSERDLAAWALALAAAAPGPGPGAS